MRTATFFACECSTCGRTLHVRVEYLGKRVACPHCRAEHIAIDPQLRPHESSPHIGVMQRVDHLLQLETAALQPHGSDVK
jgi:predicted RNA-binding Zn-ribbon protein involved in translation (DUF1610 family)